MDCIKCCNVIPEARLKALPGTKTCVECSDVERNYVRTIISIPEPKASDMSKTPKRVMRKLPEFSRAKFEKVLEEAMLWLDDKPYAIKKVEQAYKDEVISGMQRRQIFEILETFKPTVPVKVKEVEHEPVDKDILYAFRNWKM